MKKILIKGINKVVSDSKCLNGNCYLQVCYNKVTCEVWGIWHTGFYVNFQTYYDDCNIVTLFNTFVRVFRKDIINAVNDLI